MPVALDRALDGVVLDTNEPGLMVAFRIEPDGTIVFMMFTDLWNR